MTYLRKSEKLFLGKQSHCYSSKTLSVTPIAIISSLYPRKQSSRNCSSLSVLLCVNCCLSYNMFRIVCAVATHGLAIADALILYWIQTGNMQSDELMKVSPISRCNEGNNQSAPWNPAESSHCNRRRILPQEMQNDLERPSSQDLPPPPPPSPLPHPHSLPLLEKPLPIVTTSNGRSDLLGRGLDQGLGPGQGGSGQCRALGVGDCGPGLGVGRNPLVQELSELESQILVIKQQLQSAMRRKRELEQYQSENQQANQTAPSQPTSHQSNQFVQYTQTHQQINQHKNTCPEFWSQSQFVQERKPWLTHWTSFQNLSWVLETNPCLSSEVRTLTDFQWQDPPYGSGAPLNTALKCSAVIRSCSAIPSRTFSHSWNMRSN